MASTKTLLWIERLVWILIYAGLFAVVLGVVTLPHESVAAWTLFVSGGCATVAGIVLIWVRSRLKPHP
jgi:hypothetical protein